MRRAELAHILRAAAQITDDDEMLVIGSQAILASHEEGDLPIEAWRSIEADVAFFDDPSDRKSDLVDGAIGEDSHFHSSFGIYGQGVSVTTAVLPAGWRDRLVPFERPDAGTSRARCLDAHDLVCSKLAAGREKDFQFAWALLRAGLVRGDVLVERAAVLETVPAVRSRVVHWVRAAQARLAEGR